MYQAPEATPIERAQQVGVIGGGLAFGAWATHRVWRPALSWNNARRAGASAGRGLAAYGRGIMADFRKEAASVGRFKAMPRLAPYPVAMGVGALIGAAAAGEGHRTQGAVVGAGVGFAAKGVVSSISTWNKIGQRLGVAGKLGASAMLTVGAYGVGRSLNHPYADEQAGVANPFTGETDYVSTAEAQTRASGVRRRMDTIGASGDLVFGLNGRRHG